MMGREVTRHSPFVEYIGAQREEMGEGLARLSITIGPQHTNPNAVLPRKDGGVVTTIMDSAIGAALGALRGGEASRRPHAMIEMNASFLAAARPGDEVVVEGRVVRLRRTVAFAEAEAPRRGDGAVSATARLTFGIPERRR